MNRFKISKAQYPAAKKYLEGTAFKKDSPSWCVKFKEDLSFRQGKLYYKELRVIPQEDVDKYLRDLVYNKKSDVPLSRDGAHHLIKQRVVGITRARLMKFLKAQSAVESTKNANRKPKRTSGPKQKAYTFQCDLVFIRKPDLVEISKRFNKTVKQKESYIVSVVEKITGLTALDYVLVKEQEVVTPIVIKLIQSICDKLGIDPKNYSGESDSGGEFSKEKLGQFMKKWDFVKVGSSIEKKNSTIQSRMFQLARARRGYKIKTLLKQVETIENNNFNSVQKKTPNEAAEESKEDESVAKYNAKRKKYISGQTTKFKVGDYVRIQLLKGKNLGGVAFKSYKGETFSKRVYKITHATKNANPPKYRVNGKWKLGDDLSLSAPIDMESEQLISNREDQAKALERLEEKQAMLEQYKEDAEKKKRGRPNQRMARRNRRLRRQARE